MKIQKPGDEGLDPTPDYRMTPLDLVINYLDQIAIEKISTETKNWATIGSRLFELAICYSLYFIGTKGLQFVISLLLKVEMNAINPLYFLLPYLYMIEVGMSKLDYPNFSNFIRFSVRATLKAIVVFGLDMAARLIPGMD